MAKKRTQDQIEADIIAGLDIIAEYERMGVTFSRDEPRSSGMIPCYSRMRGTTGTEADRNPAAVANALNGRYQDLSTLESFSLWNFAVNYSTQPVFKDWR